MSSVLVWPSIFRKAIVFLGVGVLGLLASLACGGGGSAAVPPPTPVITSFGAAKTPITTGTTTTLTAVFSNGTGVIDKGVGTITSGTPVTVAPTADTTYTLTVTNSASVATVSTTAVALAPAPSVPVITALTKVTAGLGGYTASTPAQAGMTLAWTITNGTFTSAASGASVTFTPGTTGSVSLSCVATNAANTPSSAGLATATIVAAPSTPVITAPTHVSAGETGYRASVPAQADSTYTWTLSGGTLVTGAGTASITFAPGSTGSVVLGCQVTNGAGTPSTAASASSLIVAFPTIEQLYVSETEVASGTATLLGFAFSGGTGVVDHAIGTVTSGATREVKPTVTTTYTLRVTNLAGDYTYDSVTVSVPDPATITAFRANPAAITRGQGTLLTFTFTGDGSIDQGVGTVTSGSQIAVLPTVGTTYTLTTTNSVGQATQQALTVAVRTFTSKFVYVANAGGGISGFSLNEATGALQALAQSPYDIATTALHVTSDPAGKFLFVVNGNGVVKVNTLTVYSINATTGALTRVAAYATGTGPWSAAVDPGGKFVYVRCEGSLSAYALNATTGALLPLATPSIATAGGTGDVLIHGSGLYLFTAGRTSDTLQVFTLNPATGALTPNATRNLPASTGPLALALSHTGEYLYTKSEGRAGGAAQACLVYGYHVDVATGGLTDLAPMDTGLNNSDAYHGVAANPTQAVIYITLVNSDNDFAAYALDLISGALTPIMDDDYDLFEAAGSDCLVVSRSGKWGFLADYHGNQIALCSVDPVTGVLLEPTFYPTGTAPVSITVVGTIP
ncbi:MAG: beta-propeller fold lactonase family protein [Holophagaceae bacterium]